jgi:hypothetical protein
MSQQDKDKAAAKKAASSATRSNATAPGVSAPEPHEAANASPAVDAPGVAPAAEVEEQRTDEQQASLDAAVAAGTGGAATPAEKGQQTRAAAEVREQAEADAKARAAAEADTKAQQEQDTLDEAAASEDPVQRQRREEAEAAAKAAAGPEVSEEDALLLAAAPGGQRTALTKGKEGSTTVTHTAAQKRSPLSGPLHAPVNDIENLRATEDDPDNRVYADEAGPRDVFKDTEATKARYIDADGNPLSYDDIFEDDGKTFVTTKTRVYETFVFPNTVTEGKRLAYAVGKRVPKGEAENVRNQISVHSPIY